MIPNFSPMSETCSTPERWFITENDQLGTGGYDYDVYFIFLFEKLEKHVITCYEECECSSPLWSVHVCPTIAS